MPSYLHAHMEQSLTTNLAVTDFLPGISIRFNVSETHEQTAFNVFVYHVNRSAPSALVYSLHSNYLQQKLLTSFHYSGHAVETISKKNNFFPDRTFISERSSMDVTIVQVATVTSSFQRA